MQVFVSTRPHREVIVVRLSLPLLGPLRVEVPRIIRISRGR
jgi:hypothetical protein